MPQVELHYTKGLTIDSAELFSAIERTINELDNSAGICKSRAYCIEDYLHTHINLGIELIQKPHRNPRFMESCRQRLQETLQNFLPKDCAWSLSLDFSPTYYVAG